MADIILNVFQKSGFFFHSELAFSLSLSLYDFFPYRIYKDPIDGDLRNNQWLCIALIRLKLWLWHFIPSSLISA